MSVWLLGNNIANVQISCIRAAVLHRAVVPGVRNNGSPVVSSEDDVPPAAVFKSPVNLLLNPGVDVSEYDVVYVGVIFVDGGGPGRLCSVC